MQTQICTNKHHKQRYVQRYIQTNIINNDMYKQT